MPRIRTVKPEFWTDSAVVRLSPFARLLFIGAWNVADDYGALAADATQLRLRVLPADPVDADALVDELLAAGLLVETVNAEGVRFWRVRSWSRHQRIDRPSGSIYGDPDTWTDAAAFDDPAPADDGHSDADIARIRRGLDEPSRAFDEPSTSPRAGREGKGRELFRARAHARETAPPVDNPPPVDDYDPDPSKLDELRERFPALDVVEELETFRLHYRSTGAERRSWPAAFEAWLRTATKLRREGGAGSGPGPPSRAPVYGSAAWHERVAEHHERERTVLGKGGS